MPNSTHSADVIAARIPVAAIGQIDAGATTSHQKQAQPPRIISTPWSRRMKGPRFFILAPVCLVTRDQIPTGWHTRALSADMKGARRKQKTDIVRAISVAAYKYRSTRRQRRRVAPFFSIDPDRSAGANRSLPLGTCIVSLACASGLNSELPPNATASLECNCVLNRRRRSVFQNSCSKRVPIIKTWEVNHSVPFPRQIVPLPLPRIT